MTQRRERVLFSCQICWFLLFGRVGDPTFLCSFWIIASKLVACCFVIGANRAIPLCDLKGRGMKKYGKSLDTGILLTYNNQLTNKILGCNFVNSCSDGNPQYLTIESLHSSANTISSFQLRLIASKQVQKPCVGDQIGLE